MSGSTTWSFTTGSSVVTTGSSAAFIGENITSEGNWIRSWFARL